MPHEGCAYAAIDKRILTITGKSPKLGEVSVTDFPSQPLEGTDFANILILRLPGSRTICCLVHQHLWYFIMAVLAHSSITIHYV